MKERKSKICLMSSIPVTLWSFYRSLLICLKNEGIEVHICSSTGPELWALKNEGVKTWPVPIIRQIAPFEDLRSLFKLVRIFRRQRFDIVHAHTPKAGLLGMIASRLAGVKNRIYTCHGLPLETEQGLKRLILKICEKITFCCATKVLVVSQSLLQKVRDYGICNSDKATVLLEGTACGVDLRRFTKDEVLQSRAEKVRAELGISDDDILVGFIGRLVPDKGIGVLLKAFCTLIKEYKNIHLVIIGDYEPHRGCLSDKEVDLLDNHIKITHIAFTNDIEKYYAAMNMLVLPTRREGFPYALLEAAAMELPVIATKVTGCVDAVSDGVSGILVNVDDATELYEAILKLAIDHDLRNKFGKKGRKRVEKLFDSKRLINEHIQLYEKISNKPNN